MRSAWKVGGAAALLLVCAACASPAPPGDGDESSEAPSVASTAEADPSDAGGGAGHNPDALTGVDHLVDMCNSGAAAPPATREIVEAWANEDPKYLCNDEMGTGTYVVSGGPGVEVPEDGITALTPGEPLPEGYQLVNEDASILLIVGDELYTARFAMLYAEY